MTFSIPSGVFIVCNQIADNFITQFGVRCQLVYPGKITACSNCVTNSMVGGSSTNVYRQGGPAPFYFGECPICGGSSGFKVNEITENITLRVYWDRREWKKIGVNIDVPDADIMVIGYLTDLPKFNRANEVIVNTAQSQYRNWRFIRSSEPAYYGITKNRYFAGLMKRTG